jgi:beta-glucosidase
MPWLAGPKAILEAGLGGQAVGGAIVDVLSGQVNPSGKLAETFPLKLEDTPAFLNFPGEAGEVRYGEGLFVGYRYYDKRQVKPLFPFGYGLSYTTFEYSGIALSKNTTQAGETLEVRVTLRNSGARAGKEVVQIYVRPLESGYTRPTRDLKAFAKVELQPGETKEVSLNLQERDFMVFDSERQAWRMEGGRYQIEAGGSCEQPAQKVDVTVIEDPQSARRRFSRATLLKHVIEDEAGRAAAIELFAGSRVANWLTGTDEMFLAIPIFKTASLGGISEEAIDNLIANLNR